MTCIGRGRASSMLHFANSFKAPGGIRSLVTSGVSSLTNIAAPFSTTGSNSRHKVSSRIELTPEEAELFKVLKTVGEWSTPKTTVRVAGGWVRDRLLGTEAKRDVDVVLDNVTGVSFATKLQAWVRSRSHGKGKGSSKPNLLPFTIGYIPPNPEKSKHLETATAHIGNYSVDFVNLRTEVYAHVEAEDSSRIPVGMQFGTVQDDAFRRDLTINSLFYNLHTKQVEDFTGRGLRDLRRGIVRTPFEPLETFKDDPLRILRLIRFACRFKFDIATAITRALRLGLNPTATNAAAGHTENRDSLRTVNMIRILNAKIARERITDEVEKMLSSGGLGRASATASSSDSGESGALSVLDSKIRSHSYAPERAVNLLASTDILRKAILLAPEELVYVPTAESRMSMLHVVHDGIKGGVKAANGDELAQAPPTVQLNRANCGEMDQFVEYGESMLYLLRLLESYLLDGGDHMRGRFPRLYELLSAAKTAPFDREDAKYLRYASLVWWAKDKYIHYHSAQPPGLPHSAAADKAARDSERFGKNLKQLKCLSLSEYLCTHSLRLSNRDNAIIANIQKTADQFGSMFQRIQDWKEHHADADAAKFAPGDSNVANRYGPLARSDLALMIRASLKSAGTGTINTAKGGSKGAASAVDKRGNVQSTSASTSQQSDDKDQKTHLYRYAALVAAADVLLKDIVDNNQHLVESSMRDHGGEGSNPVKQVNTIPRFPYNLLARMFDGSVPVQDEDDEDSNRRSGSRAEAEGLPSSASGKWTLRAHHYITPTAGVSAAAGSAITLPEKSFLRAASLLEFLLTGLEKMQLLGHEEANAASVRPKFNGNDIMKMIQKAAIDKESNQSQHKNQQQSAPYSGIIIGAMMTEQLEWQLQHPGSDREHLLQHLKEKFKEYL